MNAIPRVSVVMPVYNGVALIGRSLSTALAQTFRDIEIIVMDDGSADDVGAAVAQHSDPRLRLIRWQTNSGAAAARNHAIRAARGAYVAFLDCDDEWLPDKLARQYRQLEQGPAGTGVSITGYYLERHEVGRRDARPLASTSDWNKLFLSGCQVALGSCAMVRRTVFDDIGFFDESMRRLYDWDWLLRYTSRAPIANIEEPLAIVHAGSHWPSVDVVRRATSQMWERHGDEIAKRSWRARRLFRSTIAYELAAAYYNHDQPLAALGQLLYAIALWPARDLDFYRHIVRRGADLPMRRSPASGD